MFVKDNISRDYPAFDYDTPLKDVVKAIEGFPYAHIFVVRKDILAGALSREVLLNSKAEKVGALEVHLQYFSIAEGSTLIDSVKIFDTFETDILPVTDINGRFLGTVAYEDVFRVFARFPFFSENGAFLIVETGMGNYSLSKVAEIVEHNNLKLYGAFIYKMEEDRIQVAIKVNGEGNSSMDETFERYDYTLVYKFYRDSRDELLKDRLDFLQKYMEI